MGANHTDLHRTFSWPGKVTKPPDLKGALTTILSCLPVITAMLRAQLVADWLPTHPVGGATMRGSRELGLFFFCLFFFKHRVEQGLFSSHQFVSPHLFLPVSRKSILARHEGCSNSKNVSQGERNEDASQKSYEQILTFKMCGLK